jgi:hypothetical protein
MSGFENGFRQPDGMGFVFFSGGYKRPFLVGETDLAGTLSVLGGISLR